MSITRALLSTVVVASLTLLPVSLRAEISLTEADDRGVTFICRPELERPVRDVGGEVELHLKGAGMLQEVGRPIEPVYWVTVAIPPSARPTAHLLTRSPGERFAGALRVFNPPEAPPTARTMTADRRHGVVGELEIRRLGGISVVRVPVFPVESDPRRSELNLASRIEVRVNFNRARPAAAGAGSRLSNFARQVVINPEQASLWSGVTSEFRYRGWPVGYLYRFEVSREGMYRLSYEQMTGRGVRFPSGAIPSRTVRLFGGRGLALSPDPGVLVETGLAECPIIVMDGGDGLFGAGDYILFYGRGAGGWTSDTTGWRWEVNPFANANTYWLNIDPGGDGLRMEPLMTDIIADTAVSAVRCRIHVEPESFIYGGESFVGTGTRWYGFTFDGASRISYPIDLPSAVTGLPMTLSFRVVNAIWRSTPDMTVTINQQMVTRFSPGSHTAPNERRLSGMEQFFTSGTNAIAFEQNLTGARALFDWLDVSYYGALDRTRLFELSADGNVRLDLSRLGNDPHLFDITEHGFVRFARGASPTVVGRRFGRYAAVSGGGFESVTSRFEEYFPPDGDVIDLLSGSNRADVVMVCADLLWDAAEPLKAQFARRDPPLQAVRVRLREIYNRFSSGTPDPAAVRNFLMLATERWAKGPDYVLMVGDGDFNYRDIGRPKLEVFLPPYQEESISSDDWFVDFTPWGGRRAGILPEIPIGRLTASSPWELRNMVDKIIAYDEKPTFGTWRNRVTLVADDEYGERSGSEDEHVNGTEDIASNYLPASLEKMRVYLTEYPREWGREKPRASDQLVSLINQGTLIVNYMGHGNPTLWAHEYVFVLSRDLARIEPNPRQALFIAFTCDWAYWDNPSGQSFPEQLLSMPGGGAIGAIASTRLTYAFSNTSLARNYFRIQFGASRPTIGQALALAKHQAQISLGPTYYLLGDPALHLANPRLSGRFTALNPSALQPQGHVELEAVVVDDGGGQAAEFDGRMELLLLDTDVLRTYIIRWFDPQGNVREIPLHYRLNGSMVFRGTFSVTDGAGAGRFVVPKDVTLGGELGRMFGYFYNGRIDGIAAMDSVRFANSAAARLDTTAPEIRIFFDHRSYRAGDPVVSWPTLIVELFDSSGLNLTGAMGHGVSVAFDGGLPVDLTASFSYHLDNYQTGSLEREVGPLTPGRHHVEVQAWDSFNNLGVATMDINVIDSEGDLIVDRVLNWPNPFRDETALTFTVNRAVDWQVHVFTVGGRMIREFKGTATSPGLVKDAVWNGRDLNGRTIANGVYLYKVTARDQFGNSAEGLGRIAYIR